MPPVNPKCSEKDSCNRMTDRSAWEEATQPRNSGPHAGAQRSTAAPTWLRDHTHALHTAFPSRRPPSPGASPAKKSQSRQNTGSTQMSTQGCCGSETILTVAGWHPRDMRGFAEIPRLRAKKYRHACTIQKKESRPSQGIMAQKSSDPKTF